MMDSINFNQVSVGAEASALTQNMVALRRYHRQVYGVSRGYLELSGTITSSTSSMTVTGSGTRFLTELFVGAKLMKADHVTVLGYVKSIESDTSLTLLANAASTNAGVAATFVPHLVWCSFGDSVARLKNNFILPRLNAALGRIGFAGERAANVGGLTLDASSGTVIQPNGSLVPYDYTYWPSGQHYYLNESSSARFGWSAAPLTGNVFRVYIPKGPAFGANITVRLLDGSNSVTNSTNYDASAGSVEFGYVEFNLGASPAARRVEVVTGAGEECVVIAVSARDTTKPGTIMTGVNRGGLSLTDILSCPNLHLVAGFMGVERPSIFTYEMREGPDVDISTALPETLDALTEMWDEADWLFYGGTPGNLDAGFAKEEAPTWIENESVRKVALQSGYAFFDGYTPLGSYEDLLAIDPAYDGNHVNEQLSHWLASLAVRQFGLLDFCLMPLAPVAMNTPTVWTTGVRFNKILDPLVTDAGRIAPEPVYGVDLQAYLNRWVSFTDAAGVDRLAFGSAKSSYGLAWIFAGKSGVQFTTASNYNNYEWNILISAAGAPSLNRKDGSGNFGTIALPGGAATVAGLPAASGYLPGSAYYATNGRKSGEGMGAGTGCPVYSNGSNWLTYYDDTVVAA